MDANGTVQTGLKWLWLCDTAIMWLCDYVTRWPSDSVIMWPCDSVTMWLCYPVILWLCDSDSVTLWPGDPATLWLFDSLTLWPYDNVTLWLCGSVLGRDLRVFIIRRPCSAHLHSTYLLLRGNCCQLVLRLVFLLSPTYLTEVARRFFQTHYFYIFSNDNVNPYMKGMGTLGWTMKCEELCKTLNENYLEVTKHADTNNCQNNAELQHLRVTRFLEWFGEIYYNYKERGLIVGLPLYKAMARSHLEYCTHARMPFRRRDICLK